MKSLPSPDDCLALVGAVADNSLDWRSHAEALLESCPRHAFVAAVYALEEAVKCFWLAAYGLGVVTDKNEATDIMSRHDLKHRFSAVVESMPTLEAVASLLTPVFAEMERALSAIDGGAADISLSPVAPELAEHLRKMLGQVLPTVLASLEGDPERDASLVATVGRWEALRRAAVYVDPGDHPAPPTGEDCQQCLSLVSMWEPFLSFSAKNLTAISSEFAAQLRLIFADLVQQMNRPGQ